MAQVHGSVICVRADALEGFPEVFQKFVLDYFKPTKVFGIDCYFAFGELDGRKDGIGFGENRRKGVRPTHSVHLRDKVEGDLSLYEWIQKMVNDKNEERIFELSEFWDDGSHVDYE